MPVKSARQYKYMAMIAHGKKTSGIGPSKKVAEDFIHATPKNKRSEFMKGK